MKNLTQPEKEEILNHVRLILDAKDIEIHVQLSREMKETTKPGDTDPTFDTTGAVAVCLSKVSAPAVLWAKEVEELKASGR